MFTNLGRFFVVLRRGHVLWHKSGGIFLRRMSLVDSALVKMCKFFFEKSCEKIWFGGKNGSTFATANGERRFPTPKSPLGDLAEREKVATFAEPTLWVGRGH